MLARLLFHIMIPLTLAAVARPGHHQSRNHTALISAKLIGGDKCMKDRWPDVSHSCDEGVGYHGGCQARIGSFGKKYGSCAAYCSSFGFECSSGLVPAIGEHGCTASSPKSKYLPCSDRTDADEAICNCRDQFDTHMWRGADAACGPGLAHVRHSVAGNCDQFCAIQGMTCVEANHGESCNAATSTTCDAPIHKESGSLCQCSGGFDRAGTFMWPDKIKQCGASTVLVAGHVLKATAGNCQGYCESLRDKVPGYNYFFMCYAAWPAHQGTDCGAYLQSSRQEKMLRGGQWSNPCSQDMHGEDAVCSCSFPDF